MIGVVMKYRNGSGMLGNEFWMLVNEFWEWN